MWGNEPVTGPDDARSLSRSLRSAWQGCASMNTIRSTHSEASAVVYDASRVSLTGGDDGIGIRTRSSLVTLPMSQLKEVVERDELPDALGRIDVQLRKALPPLFLAAFDDWARRDFALEPMPDLNRAPSARLTIDQIEAGMTSFWGGDISEVRSDDSGQNVRAVLYHRIPIVLSVDFSHGQVNGNIALDDGYLAHSFGTWLLADHPDSTGLCRVNELIDKWARLRLGLTSR